MCDDIVLVHLVTGEVIVGRKKPKLSMTDTVVVIIDPMLIATVPAEIGRIHHVLTPYGSLFGMLPPIELLSLTPEKMLIEPRNDVPDHLKDSYIQSTARDDLTTDLPKNILPFVRN